MREIIDLPKVSRGIFDDVSLVLRASSFDVAKNTIDVVWTTGATVRRLSWTDGPVDEQLVVTPEAVRLDRLNSGAPFLASHAAGDLDAIIGAVVRGSAKIKGGTGTATIQLSREAADAAIVGKIRDGIITGISCGYRVHGIEKIESKSAAVPLWRVIDWEPLEISAVAVPADPKSQVRGSKSAERFPAKLTTLDPAYVVAARMRMRQRQLDAELASRRGQ
jgi:hypothetical protein